MPALRKSSAQHELSGSYRVHPERKRARQFEPKPAVGLGEAPALLEPDEVSVWEQLKLETVPGHLTVSDRLCVEMFCRAVARYRRGEAKGFDVSLICKGWTVLGITPADRSRIVAETDHQTPEERAIRELLADDAN
jgi:phage terminase small subunit